MIDLSEKFYLNQQSLNGLLLKHEKLSGLDKKAIIPATSNKKAEAKSMGESYFIDIKGILVGGEIGFMDFIFGASSLNAIKREISEAIKLGYSNVVFLVDSPGGTVKGTKEVADYIYSLREENITTYAYVDGLMASAAYWIGSACEKIYIAETAEVGSIGVVTTIFDDKEYFAKAGIKIEDVTNTTAKNKRMDYFSEAGRAKLIKDLDFLAEVFYQGVRRNRGDETATEKYGDGKTYTSDQALRLGMVDGVMGFEDFLKTIGVKKTMETTTLKPKAETEREAETRVENNAEAIKTASKQAVEQERQRALDILSLVGSSDNKIQAIKEGLGISKAIAFLKEANAKELEAGNNGFIKTAKDEDLVPQEKSAEEQEAEAKKRAEEILKK